MGKYGQATLRAMDFILLHKYDSPIEAWEAATIEIFGEGTSSQAKGCPKSTFLGLCEVGLVKGVAQGSYLKRKPSLNQMYGIKAIKLLEMQPSFTMNISRLWGAVLEGETKKHNSQMEVVVSLWVNGYINCEVR